MVTVVLTVVLTKCRSAYCGAVDVDVGKDLNVDVAGLIIWVKG
jgi:hypothetical protein